MTATSPTDPTRDTPKPEVPPTGRDARGRFAPGNPGGYGNPFARKVAALRQALLDAVQPEDLAAVIRAMIAKAKAGDATAARLVLAYTVGKPSPAVDPDRLDTDEWQRFKEGGAAFAEMPRVGDKPAPELPLKLVRQVRPLLTEYWAEIMEGMLKAPPADPEPPACQEQPGDDTPPSPDGLTAEDDELCQAFCEMLAAAIGAEPPPRRPSPHGANGRGPAPKS